MNKKRGLTMMSLVVYVVLLAAFTGVALTVSNNLSNSVFADKGIAYDMTNYEKIMYYLNKSAMESSSADATSSTVTFSNGDKFEYNATKNELKMNGGVLCRNVYTFSIGDIQNNLLNIDITLKKYTHSMDRSITLYIGEWVYAKKQQND